MTLDEAAKELYYRLQLEKRDITVGINEANNTLVMNVYDNVHTATLREFLGFKVEVNDRVGQRKGVFVNIDETFKL